MARLTLRSIMLLVSAFQSFHGTESRRSWARGVDPVMRLEGFQGADDSGSLTIIRRIQEDTEGCSPKVVEVGGKEGWAFGIFAQWKQPRIFVGDSLHFSWNAMSAGESTHTVHRFPGETQFKDCDFDGGKELGINDVTFGPIKVPGWYYFGCAAPGHCQGLSQKVRILVLPAPNCAPSRHPPPEQAPSKDLPAVPEFGSPPARPAPQASECEPQKVDVGGKKGWSYGILTDWTQPKVYVGDTLFFSWDEAEAGEGGGHAVYKFDSKKYFDTCDFTGASFWGYNNVSLGPIAEPGKYYFGCNTPGHCSDLKQRVEITVLPEPSCRKQPSLPPPRPPCKSKTVDVGGELGWTFGVEKTWKQPDIYVGDSIKFSWDPVAAGDVQHNVVLLRSKAHFLSCNFTQARFVGFNNDTVWLRWPGTFYFACSIPGHCSPLGQKVSVTVLPAAECPQDR